MMARVMNSETRTLSRLQRWVEQESPGGDEERANRLARDIAAELRELGAGIEARPATGWGTHLRAEIPGREPGLEPILLLGHLDTVHPVGTLKELPFQIDEERIEGPAVYDMKAGLVVLTEALYLLQETGSDRKSTRLNSSHVATAY